MGQDGVVPGGAVTAGDQASGQFAGIVRTAPIFDGGATAFIASG